MFIINGVSRWHAAVLNFFLMLDQFGGNKVDLEIKKDLKKDLVDQKEYTQELIDRKNEIKKIFQQREPNNILKSILIKKRRIVGKAVFDSEKFNLLKDFKKVRAGELVAYHDDDEQKIIYAIIYEIINYKQFGKSEIQSFCRLYVGEDDDGKVFKTQVFPDKVYKFS